MRNARRESWSGSRVFANSLLLRGDRMIDIHTHLMPAGCVTEEFLREATLMRNDATIKMETLPEDHWNAMEGVERAVVLAMRFLHLSVNVTNAVASYVR